MNLKDKVYIIDIIKNNRFKVFKFNIILIKIISFTNLFIKMMIIYLNSVKEHNICYL
jgi:hypothetical protein